MPCYRPKPAAVLLANKKTRPEMMPTKLPCGKCIGCIISKRQEWTIRMSHEHQYSDEAVFLTLTYNEDHLPNDLSLEKKGTRGGVVATFLQDVRNHLGPFRYYFIGEYGTENLRPHYHAILFFRDAEDGKRRCFPDRVEWVSNSREPVYRSPLLERLWPYGFSTVQHVTVGSIKYVAGYVQKKLGDLDDPHGRRYDRVDPETGEVWTVHPEWQTMSRRPGLGHDWIRDHWRDIYPSDHLVLDGRNYKPPLYYDRQVEKHSPELVREVRRRRLEREVPSYNKTTECLAAAETITMGRESLKVRPL